MKALKEEHDTIVALLVGLADRGFTVQESLSVFVQRQLPMGHVMNAMGSSKIIFLSK